MKPKFTLIVSMECFQQTCRTQRAQFTKQAILFLFNKTCAQFKYTFVCKEISLLKEALKVLCIAKAISYKNSMLCNVFTHYKCSLGDNQKLCVACTYNNINIVALLESKSKLMFFYIAWLAFFWYLKAQLKAIPF